MKSLPSNVVRRYLRGILARTFTAAPGQKLDSKTRQEINRMLDRAGLDGNKRFEKAEHGFSRAMDVLSKFGIEQDEIPNSHIFTRPDGRFTVDLAFSNPQDAFSPQAISNSMLVVTFHELAPYKFEVIAYVS